MTNKFSCIIIDDEPYLTELLSENLKNLYDNIEITGIYTTWKEASQALRSMDPDILFLDISIKGKNSMDLLKLAPNLTSEIIFVTAFTEYALNAFKYSATGYLLKPVDEIELAVAVDKAIERITNKRPLQQTQNTSGNPHTINSKIGVPNNKGIEYVTINDIIYLEAIKTYTKVVTITEIITSSYNMRKYKDLLTDHMFYQVHKSYTVNLNCIRRYENNGTIVMNNNAVIPVSKNVREDFLNSFIRIKGEERKNE